MRAGQIGPRFLSALWVLCFGAIGFVFVAVAKLVESFFGGRLSFSSLLTAIAIPVCSMGLGALLSALLWTSDHRDTPKWLRLTLFGASSAFVFGLLTQMRQGPPIDPVFCALITLGGAVFLPLVRWLSAKGL